MSVVTNTTTIGAIDAPSRRNTELVLVVFAVAISVFAYANVGLALNGELPAGMLGYGAGLALLGGVAHLVCAGSPSTPTRCCCPWPPC